MISSEFRSVGIVFFIYLFIYLFFWKSQKFVQLDEAFKRYRDSKIVDFNGV